MKPCWRTTDHIVIAVSTGIDSMVLLHQLLTQYADTYDQLTCLHVHHGLREASDNEAQFLQTYCQERNIPLHIHHLDLTSIAEAGRSIQNEARRLRYTWFDKMMYNLQADCLLTAHHQGDQLETIFYRIFTGRVDRGPLGIQTCESRGLYRLIRPLLTTTKEQIRTYQQQHTVPYFEDESNTSNAYVRNDIRNRLLPDIEQNPQLQGQQLLKLMDVHAEALTLFKQRAQQFIEQEVRQKHGNQWYIPRKPFNQLSPHVKMKVLDIMLAHFESVVTVSERTYQDWFVKICSDVAQSTLMHTNKWHVDIVYDKLVIAPAMKETIPTQQVVTMAGIYRFGAYRIEIAEHVFRSHEMLHIRTRQTGDRIMLANGQHKKVTRLMIDHKVPQGERLHMPIISTANGDILAVGTCYHHMTYEQYIHIQYLGDDINEK